MARQNACRDVGRTRLERTCYRTRVMVSKAPRELRWAVEEVGHSCV